MGFGDGGFLGTEVAHLRHQLEPAAVFLAHPRRVGTGAIELGQRRPASKPIPEGEVVLGGAVAVECLEEVDQLEVVVDEAARWQLQPAVLDLAGELGQLPVGGTALGQGLRLVQEAVVVADEIENH